MRGVVFMTLILACTLIAAAFLSIAAVILLSAPGCAHATPLPPGLLTKPGLPDRLFCVERDAFDTCLIYRSAQPSPEQFKALVAQYGIKSVVKLNGELPFDGGPDVVPDGVTVTKEDWLPAGPVEHDKTEEALEDLSALPRPTLVHCTHGINRTGLLVALWRVKNSSAAFAAHSEWVAYGQDDVAFPLLLDAFERETGWEP